MPVSPRPLLSLSWRWFVPAAALIVLFHFVPGGETLDRAFLDFAGRHPLRTPPVPEGSALVLIDDRSLEELGREGFGLRWPFPRKAFALLVLALHQAGAKCILMDFVFAEPSESAAQDRLLGATAAAVRPTVLARTPKLTPVFWDDAFRKEHAAFFSTARVGDVTFTTDDDGVVRSYQTRGSLAAAGFDPPATASGGLLRWHGGLKQIQARGVPVLSAGQYIQAGKFIPDRIVVKAPNLTPEEVARALADEPLLEGAIADAVRGRVVFVAANAAGTFDLKTLPVGSEPEPGVLIHWTAWANLKSGGFIIALPRWLALVGGLVVAGLVGVVGVRSPGITAPALAAGALTLVCGGGAYAAHSAGWFFSPATSAASALFALLGVTAENFLLERQRKRSIQAMFGSYVAPEVVAQLVRDPMAIRLGGERRELTVLFADLAGFTELSEKVPADRLLAIINLYLQEISDCLLTGGAYIDKYIGDAVMAVYGAPLSQTDHAMAACEGALAAQQALARLNPIFERDFGCTLRMRIGINTGEMIVGNLGSERKKNYTVLGDAVNLASRLEGANKEFGTAILLGETTAARVRGRLATRPLTRLRVKGKSEAVEVHELVGQPGGLTPAQETFLAAYGEGYAAICARRFAEAAAAFTRAHTLAPADMMTRAWHEQASAYAVQPPPPDWQPLLKLESK